MSSAEKIVRIAAKGDGVSESGKHVAGAATGDLLAADGTVEPGPHHVEPVCQHFATCGGCELQHAGEPALEQFVRERVVFAAEGQGLEVPDLLATHLSPPHSRRRATLHGLRTAKGAVLGFREKGSNRVVDMRECHILSPGITALFPAIRALIAQHGGRGSTDVSLAVVDQGIDCAIGNFAMEGLEATEAVLDFARDNGLARVTVDMGYGAEAVWEPEPVTVTLSGVPVAYPSGSFLQATLDAEAVMTSDVGSWLRGSTKVADLFAGLGTFAFALDNAHEVTAFEAARDPHLSCLSAARRSGKRIDAKHRDLFRNPIQPDELDDFDAVVIDPPRAGAKEQVQAIAKSKLPRVAYVSCNPSSWARDAAQLFAAGFRLEQLRPVGQFRWSTHVELTSLFVR